MTNKTYKLQDLHKYLSKFNLNNDFHKAPISTLSGGQKARLEFCRLYLLNCDIICLDEPSNHLDMEALDALSSAIRGFNGSILLVSHDATMLKEMDLIWEVQGGAVKEVGDFNNYKQKILADLHQNSLKLVEQSQIKWKQKINLLNKVNDSENDDDKNKNINKTKNSTKLNKIDSEDINNNFDEN